MRTNLFLLWPPPGRLHAWLLRSCIAICALWANGITAYAQETAGLIAYYPFDGNAQDMSGNGNHGDASNATLTTDRFGKPNSAYAFGGIGNRGHIRVPNSPSLHLHDKFTFSAWVKLSTLNGMSDYGGTTSGLNRMTIFAKDTDRYSLYWLITNHGDQSKSMDFLGVGEGRKEYENMYYEMVPARADEWVHHAVVYDANTGITQFFRNGELIGRNRNEVGKVPVGQYVNGANQKDLYIGCYKSGWYPLAGSINEVRMYNIALTPNQVRAIYNASKAENNNSFLTHTSKIRFYEDAAFEKEVVNLSNLKVKTNYYFKASVKNTSDEDFTGNFYLKVSQGLKDYAVIKGQTISAQQTATLTGVIQTNNAVRSLPLRLFYANATMKRGEEVTGGTVTVSFKSADEVASLPEAHVVNPQITIHNSRVEPGQVLRISGRNFTPNGTFSGTIGWGSIFKKPVDENGEFTLEYMISEHADAVDQPINPVVLKDDATQKSAPIKNYRVIIPQSPETAYLSFISPKPQDKYHVGNYITVEWADIMYRKANGVTYPFEEKSGQRSYGYDVMYRKYPTEDWQLLDRIEGKAPFDKLRVFEARNVVKISHPDEKIQIKIIDRYNPALERLCDSIQIVPSGKFTMKFRWDYSYPRRESMPFVRGVAADGTGRFYIDIAKNFSAEKLQSVRLILSDEYGNQSPSLLGKVMKANVIDRYTTEANAASEINSLTIGDQDRYTFWYVAPDNFCVDPSSSLVNRSSRQVNLTAIVTYETGEESRITKKIEVVRPPLMMVHGLSGDEHTWDNFHYTALGGRTRFVDSGLFIQKKAINMYPNSVYNHNTYLVLMSPENENSLYSNIQAVRNQGYACNQVDYVCHSMGGAVLRNSMENHLAFYDKAANKKYPKSYSQGLVHKAITINTPHNGSPLADLLTEYIPEVFNFKWNISNFIANTAVLNVGMYKGTNHKLFSFLEHENGSVNRYIATGAVRNLQAQGAEGVAFKASRVKNHLIAGDTKLVSKETTQALEYFGHYLDLIDDILKIAHKMALPGTRSSLKAMMAASKGVRAFNFLEWYSKSKGFPLFLAESDLIVPLSSQLATHPKAYPLYKRDATTIYENSSWFNANHLEIVDRADVGNGVLSLLNSDVHDKKLFADEIPANIIKTNRTKNKPLSMVKKESDVLTKDYINNEKIEIVDPVRNTTLWADSTVTIAIQVKDTVNLDYISYSFQNESDLLVNQEEEQSITLQVSPQLLGKQYIIASAVYTYPDSIVTYTDTLSVMVDTQAKLLGFESKMKSIDGYKDVRLRPTFLATYSNGVVEVPYNSPHLSFEIGEPDLLLYSPEEVAFIGVDSLSTYVKVNYKEFTDTLYFYISNVQTDDVITAIEESVPTRYAEENNIIVDINSEGTSLEIVTDEQWINANYRLITIDGRNLHSGSLTSVQQQISLPSGITPGVYCIQFVSPHQSVTKKFVIHN